MLLGLGSIVGTGVFVSIGLAAELAGRQLWIAIGLSALLALVNGLSSAQLAAVHPVSGGSYEYGRRFLGNAIGFVAGVTFLFAKSASAATAALGIGGHLALALGKTDPVVVSVLAGLAVLLTAAIVYGGARPAARTSLVTVGISVGTLLLFSLLAFVHAEVSPREVPTAVAPVDSYSLFAASALMFVAFTGYGRIATLGEEVARPRITIPRAILITLFISAALYLIVAAAALQLVSPEAYGQLSRETGAPLESIAADRLGPWMAALVFAGAVVALFSVLVNLILGLSRVVMAMARHAELPGLFAKLNKARTVPTYATAFVTLLILVFALLGSIKGNWSLSACAVLIYYGVTNLAALRVSQPERFIPRWVSFLGLCSCAGLIFFIEPTTLAGTLAFVALMLCFRWLFLGRAIAAR